MKLAVELTFNGLAATLKRIAHDLANEREEDRRLSRSGRRPRSVTAAGRPREQIGGRDGRDRA
ncbi:hypothetical protein FQ775_12430 [Nitratireductor mangrovi]|uniref:Uncharacterized protein n=1 Tax=Nitratireductor mangrovi TaxID=2599600 RepID=A0A5B8L0L9_9HYPH|nr:hypothetical protein [Nitratireductor mangrovi]QDZ01118.1 hypothetical protein FQ775_12430 [Nitratireductor mangrovi]